MQIKLNWDKMGIMTTLICAIHCALLPLIMTSLPVLGVNIIDNTWFEWAMIGLAFVVGVYSLYHGFIRHHRNFLPVVLFAIGFVFLLLKQVYHTYPLEYILLALAVVLIISAHYINYRMCHKSRCRSPHHAH